MAKQKEGENINEFVTRQRELAAQMVDWIHSQCMAYAVHMVQSPRIFRLDITSLENEDSTWGKEIVPKGSSLNGSFIKEGEDFRYCGFQEPWMNLEGERIPGLELFFEQDLYLKDGLFHNFSNQLKITREPAEPL